MSLVRSALFAVAALAWLPALMSAQGTATVRGTVRRTSDALPLEAVRVSVRGTAVAAVTNPVGLYVLQRVPAGEQTLMFARAGQRPVILAIHVPGSGTTVADVSIEPQPIELAEIIVQAASRSAEALLEAPAAVTQVRPAEQAGAALAGQAPLALAGVPGLEVAQVGLTDFNVNARGMNSTLSRRVVVMLDGRDLAEPMLMFQEWPAFPLALDDVDRIEVVRGPGSALYGANAFGGVVDMRSAAVRDIPGWRVRLGAGEQSTRRGDLRYAAVAAGGRVGVRLSAGYQRAHDYSRSRTRLDGQDFAAEYAAATAEPVPAGFELVPLAGQTRDSVTGAALGTPDDLESLYGSARVDVYRADASIVTLDGGLGRSRNTVLVTDIGRVQIPEVNRPWARLAWEGARHFLMASYSARSQPAPAVLLAAGLPLDDRSSTLQLEGRYGGVLWGGAGRALVGGTLRQARVNTFGTLMDPADDDRTDLFYGAYGEVEVTPRASLRLIGAMRWDRSELYGPQLSPKLALVVLLNPRHSLRASINRAFLVPTELEFFFRVPAGLEDLTALENGLRASPLGPALAGVPQGQLFTVSAAVPVVAVGNPDLVPQRMVSYEAGYRAQLTPRLFVTADAFFTRDRDFVTRLVPAPLVNDRYAAWTAPPEVPPSYRTDVENAVRGGLAGTAAEFGLTRQPSGATAIVFSYGNAGRVDEYGAELAAELIVTPGLRLAGSFSLFRHDVRALSVGEVLHANTPERKGTLSLTWERAALMVSGNLRAHSGFEWVTGVFDGYVPAGTTVDLGAGYRLTRSVAADLSVTNLLDQRRFQTFGGAVIRRRLLVGVTATR